jgi:hypothetical protein
VRGCPTYVEHFKDGDEVPDALCPLHPGSFGDRARRAWQGFVGQVLKGLGGGG